MSMNDPSLNDPRRPRGQYFRDNDNSRIGWAVAALVAVGVFVLVWGMSSRDKTTITSNPPVTTGQGDEAPAAPAIPTPPR